MNFLSEWMNGRRCRDIMASKCCELQLCWGDVGEEQWLTVLAAAHFTYCCITDNIITNKWFISERQGSSLGTGNGTPVLIGVKDNSFIYRYSMWPSHRFHSFIHSTNVYWQSQQD